MMEVREKLARWSRQPPARVEGRRAAVLVPLFVRDALLWTVFTRRTESLEHHRGQISFPGGAEEPEDATLYHTALRESEEELGIRPADALPLGRLSPIVTVTLPSPYAWTPAEAEIAEVIEVPVAELTLPGVLEEREFPGREEPVLFYHHGEHVIWGATARIVQELLRALGLEF